MLYWKILVTRLSTVQLFEFPLLKFLGKVKLIISKNSFLFFEEKKYLSIPSPDFLPLLNFFSIKTACRALAWKKIFLQNSENSGYSFIKNYVYNTYHL